MAPNPLAVPDVVRQRASANGPAGQRWLDDLPGVVTALAERWDLELGAVMTGGTAAFVVAATDGQGRPCVLKVAMPLAAEDAAAFERSVLVHQLAGGRACAELLAHDPSVPAMLLERLGPNLHDLALPLAEVLGTIAATLRSFWRPLPAGSGLPTGAEKARWLASVIPSWWAELGRPCPRPVVERAVAYCGERAAAFDPSAAVLVHGDAHGWNTLAAAGGGYKLVDPEGLWSEPAHDLAVPMREYNRPLLAGETARLVRERAERLASSCGVDVEPVWQWGFVERVSTGLASLRELGGGEGPAFLEVAARCL